MSGDLFIFSSANDIINLIVIMIGVVEILPYCVGHFIMFNNSCIEVHFNTLCSLKVGKNFTVYKMNVMTTFTMFDHKCYLFMYITIK